MKLPTQASPMMRTNKLSRISQIRKENSLFPAQEDHFERAKRDCEEEFRLLLAGYPHLYRNCLDKSLFNMFGDTDRFDHFRRIATNYVNSFSFHGGL